MENMMKRLVYSLKMDEVIEMSRELRELSEMSPTEREIYAMYNPDAEIISVCDSESLISSREEILMFMN